VRSTLTADARETRPKNFILYTYLALQHGTTLSDGRRSCIFLTPKNREVLYSIAVQRTPHMPFFALQRSRHFIERDQIFGRSIGHSNCEKRLKLFAAIE
jgi:hypothetical protein